MNHRQDLDWMQYCLELAAKAKGQTAPNPLVGSVIVKQGNRLGAGFHPKAGQPHAEALAIAEARAKYGKAAIEGATLYVNLEPCNHHGRTPPCTEAIIKAGIKRVVVGMIDPDLRVSGTGCDRLRQAGIEVITGIAEAACQRLNEGFVHRVRHQTPLGIFKYAMTLDGKIATAAGHSFWITGEAARREVHLLRASCDAVITGGNTVRLDNPLLTTHNLTTHNPLRVVLSRSLDLPRDAKLWQVGNSDRGDNKGQNHPTLVITQPHANPELQSYLCDRGVEILTLPELTIQAVIQELGSRGMNQVLWECGGNLAAEAIAAGAVQKVYAFIAPKLIGDFAAPSPIADLGLRQMSQALDLRQTELRQIDRDWLITGYLNNQS
ncbi:diaminohydroxyphosphoribosylaminopyrimidine deaminase [Thalassoporum mexicanum PCC 7367]|uniref:bifunctional diaminohydroxyphosphoribosylaminopyrimidine deaminase/5-amino-6-(5-phosphoribosylamino)uracil reductase RibD n=1 Tax=Thalassoporum mexicanum TaxID=3457544 RepID=UPI00029FE4C5|nr:bifunctional diaminohydroxyphosphoribosylaminopyrimidine deaminase/5-amino-6-(5-phosphoribosylamino)uracil reductase RibD [Pseudanabaena sp. PCC 7367]AFY68440.1 diaminohydroxyphosphoribosylaminopyrimidine deaminase [Pseudanabaena sp. PCC 7367]